MSQNFQICEGKKYKDGNILLVKICKSRRLLWFSHERTPTHQNTSVQELDVRLDIHAQMFRILNWNPSITRRIMARRGRLCDATHGCLLLMLRSCSPSVPRSPLKARRLQITGAPTPVPSCRDVKLWSPSHLQLSRPPTLASLSALNLLKSSAGALVTSTCRGSQFCLSRDFPYAYFIRVGDTTNIISMSHFYISSVLIVNFVLDFREFTVWTEFFVKEQLKNQFNFLFRLC